MRLNEKNALVEWCPRHYNEHLFADHAVMREAGGSHPPPDGSACGHEHATAGSAGNEHEYATAGENDWRNTG